MQKIFFLIREPQVWTGESLILITPEDILLAEERENNTSSKQHERRLKLKKDIKMPIILNNTQCPAILDAEKESFCLLHSQAPYQITHYHDYRPGWAIYCESLNSEYQ